MIQGAIIGLIVGLVMVGIRFVQQKKGGKQVVAALKQGGPAAREALDGYVKPVHGKVSAQKLLNLLERYAWMAIMGEHDALVQESQGIDGQLNVVTQLQAQAAVGLLAHRTEAADLAFLRSVADRIDHEGGALSGLVKKQTRDLEIVARALDTRQLDPEALQRVVGRARQMGPAGKITRLRFATRAVEMAGGDASQLRQEADALLASLG